MRAKTSIGGAAQIRVDAGLAGCLPVAEVFVDVPLERGGVYITHHEQHGALRSVPRLVKPTKHLRCGVRDDLGLAERRTRADAAALKAERERLIREPHLRIGTGTSFGLDDASFAVKRGGVQRQLAGEIPQHRQRRIERFFVVRRQVELIDRGPETGERVGIGAALQAETLQLLQRFTVGEVFRAAKGHVLEQMRNALFVVVLIERAGVDPQPQRHLAGRRRVVLNLIAEAILQGADGDGGIGLLIARRIVRSAWCRLLREQHGGNEARQDKSLDADHKTRDRGHSYRPFPVPSAGSEDVALISRGPTLEQKYRARDRNQCDQCQLAEQMDERQRRSVLEEEPLH